VLRFWARRTGPIAALEAIEQGAASGRPTTFSLTTERGEQFVLSDITGKLNVGRIEIEYDLLEYLRAHDVPVAVPVRPDSGQLCVVDRGRTYLLYPMLPVDRTIPPAGMGRVYANIGAAVARLHKALAAYPGEVDSWTMDLLHAVFEAVPRIERALSGQEAAAFRDLLATRREEMAAALSDLPLQLIHGDCHGGNILLYCGEVSGFVDLDHLPTGPRVYDVGYLLADMVKARFVGICAHDEWLAHSWQVIAGYERETSLSRREKDALWSVMLATQVLFVDWFFSHERDGLARKNLQALYWIERHRNEIAERLALA
jgi:Ser/Thr protein kinase RdoA (MazF antagonist)